VTTLSAPSRRSNTASRTLADQYQPIVSVHDAVRRRKSAPVDVGNGRARLQAGRHAFDSTTVLRAAGDLASAFECTAAAFEGTGVASTAQLAALRARRVDVTALVLGWANSESPPRDPTLRLGRTVAAVLGNALLSRAAHDVMDGVSLSGWKRARCPGCGASPDLALATDKRRMLVCWRCDTMWRTDRRGCLGCGADASPTLARVPSPLLGYELAICNSCGRYIKERRGSPTHSLLVERALTAGLDEAAQLRGLRG
jgi:hypothetical protein